MCDFTVTDPDGHRLTLGRGEERLREVADHSGMAADEIAVDPTGSTAADRNRPIGVGPRRGRNQCRRDDCIDDRIDVLAARLPSQERGF